MSRWTYFGKAMAQLFFPKLCAGCGSDILDEEQMLCLACLDKLPLTSFALHASNPVEKIFWGRLPVTAASAYCYFTRDSVLQTLIHRLKYKRDRETGFFLGQLMGRALADANRFHGIDALVPLPLHPEKERKRGYNQATVLCNGMAATWGKPVWDNILTRVSRTETQTRKSRAERWQNITGKFELNPGRLSKGKHLLLVDDVVTTGATLEAAGAVLLQMENTRLSIATLAYTST